MSTVAELGVVGFPQLCVEWTPGGADSGRRALKALLDHAAGYVDAFRRRRAAQGGPNAVIGRIRGTGPGASFGRVVAAMREAFPAPLAGPFEGSPNVSGAVIMPEQAGLDGRDDAFMMLRFEAGTTDLPMHVHEDSERLIYVLEGRGTFHVSSQDWRMFDGGDMRHVPVRSRDVLMFGRSTVHTFSTADEPLLLLSYHAPFTPLTDPRQYSLPPYRVLPAEALDQNAGRPACDAAWNRLA